MLEFWGKFGFNCGMSKRILLVNPPIYDFTAFDFWLKPLGVLSVAGLLRGHAEMELFDYLERSGESDEFGKGKFDAERIETPKVLADIPRSFNRFGKERKEFREYLCNTKRFDFVIIQTVMTYWYQGVQEVIEDIKKLSPSTKIVLGGPYATICNLHAKSLGADLIIEGTDLRPLWHLLDVIPVKYQSPFWEGYDGIESGAMKLTRGCPFKCTYCSVPNVYTEFVPRSPLNCGADIDLLEERQVKNVAFYDDALLYEPTRTLIPFLQYVIQKQPGINFHTPNGLHAKFVYDELAELMVRAGFKTFYLGFESMSEDFQKSTGSKLKPRELVKAVVNLQKAGANRKNITAYAIVGHPDSDTQQLEESMRYINELGIRVMLSDFSPIPGTHDGDKCNKFADMSEPLNHNKTAFPIRLLGNDRVNELKDLCRELNGSIGAKTDQDKVYE